MSKKDGLSTSKIISIIAAVLICIGLIIFLSITESGTVTAGDVLPKLGKEPI